MNFFFSSYIDYITTLDGPDGWSKGWVYNSDCCPTRMRRQQGGGGVMIWGGIIGDELVGP